VTFFTHTKDKKKSYKDQDNYGSHIKDCLEFFRKPEKLDKDNSWYCNVCKDHVEATKTIEIYKTPAILIFCLQRFKSRGIYLKDKLEDKIDFPVHDLDMKPYVLYHKDAQGNNTDLLYDLYAVSNHTGSLAFGHYTAYAKNHESGIWYDYNDSSVSLVSSRNDEREVVTGEAYVLYYIRKDFFPDGQVDFDKIRIGLKDD
jgi:ubiquitin carboxyl-terminal hydrolase 4/11/15